jgi:hypothetical protein
MTMIPSLDPLAVQATAPPAEDQFLTTLPAAPEPTSPGAGTFSQTEGPLGQLFQQMADARGTETFAALRDRFMTDPALEGLVSGVSWHLLGARAAADAIEEMEQTIKTYLLSRLEEAARTPADQPLLGFCPQRATGGFAGWLYVLCRNGGCNLLRQQMRQPRTVPLDPATLARTASRENPMSEAEPRRDLALALQLVYGWEEGKLRQVMIGVLAGKKQVAIAQVLKLSNTTVSRLKRQGLDRLRRELAVEEPG